MAFAALAATRLEALPPPWLPALGILGALAACRHPWGRVALAASLTFAWTLWQGAAVVASRPPPTLIGTDLVATGRIASLPAERHGVARFEMEIESLRAAGRLLGNAPLRARLGVYAAEPRPRAGERWRLVVRLRPARGFRNPGGFDYGAWLFRRGIGATGYVREDPRNRRLAAPGAGAAVEVARARLRRAIARHLDGRESAGLVTALTLGERSGITGAQWELLRRTGTGHLVAISGLHVGLVSALAFALVSLLWRRAGRLPERLAARRAGALAAFAAAAAYALVAGLSLPTQRALVMVAVAAAGTLTARRPARPAVLALALIAVLALDPLSVLAPGLWLSFGAVAVILAVTAGWSRRRSRWREAVRIQLAVSLGLVPLLLTYFQQAPLVSPLANAFAVPLVGLVSVPVALAGAVLQGLGAGAVAAWAFTVTAVSLEWLLRLLELVAGLPGSDWHAPAPGWIALALAVAGVAWMLAPPGIPGRWAGAACLLPLVFPALERPAAGELEAAVLDVGQGLAVVLRTRRHVLVYDTGPRWSPDFDAGRAVVVPYLRSLGVQAVDTLVVSHDDIDHAGGSPSLLREMTVRRRYAGEGAAGDATACRAGTSWTRDGVRFAFLWPADASARNDNNRSCVLRVTSAHGTVLLAGDLLADAERRLVATGAALDATVLVAPHHGSRSSSGRRFVDAVSPRIVVFSAGYRNHFGHPAPEVVERYRRAGAEPWLTADAGAVTVKFGNEGVDVSGFRVSNRSWWRTK